MSDKLAGPDNNIEWLRVASASLSAVADRTNGRKAELARKESRKLAEIADEIERLRGELRRFIDTGDGIVQMSWEDTHRDYHQDEPYIGCPFCQPLYVLRSEVSS